jgi:putative lipoprotein (rSAM/lipoprotein system)
MKTKLFRTKCNNLLQRFIRLFSLSSIAFVVTACYGSPYAEYDVRGQVTNEDYEPLEDMQVVVKSYNKYEWADTVYTNQAGEFHTEYGMTSFGGDCLQVIVNDPKGEYLSDTVHVANNSMDKEKDSSWTAEYSVEVNIQLKK